MSSETHGSGDAKVAAAGGNGGQGGKINVNFNPEMVPGRSRVTAVYRTRATKGGRDGSGVIRFEGDPRDLHEVMPDPAFADMGSAERAESTGEVPWWHSLVYLVVVLAAVFGLTVLLMKGCGENTVPSQDNKQSVEPAKPSLTVKETKAGVLLIPVDGEPVLLEKADKGDHGDVGPQGPKGDPGTPGATGPHGSKGDKGDLGATGPAGPQGSQGERGPAGPQGPAGKNGRSGRDGKSGADGAIGSAGPQGPAGKDGISAGPVTINVIGGQYELGDAK